MNKNLMQKNKLNTFSKNIQNYIFENKQLV